MIIVRRDDGPGPDDPPPPPPPPVAPRLGFGIALVDTTGTRWDLGYGPVFLLAGASGFGAPNAEHRTRKSAALHGVTHRGLTYQSRDLTLPVEIDGNGDSLGWQTLDKAWWAGQDPRAESTLIVSGPEGGTRFLPVRYTSGGDDPLEIDPMLEARSDYELTYLAASPFWHGPGVSVAFEVVAGVDNFVPPKAPPFTIGPANAVATATVDNPGTEPAWPRWQVDGPFTGFTVGVGDAVVTLAATVLAGQSRIIDMTPRKRTVTTGAGLAAMLEATDIEFAQIPPGVDVPLFLDVAGPGVGTRIELSFDDQYTRAW